MGLNLGNIFGAAAQLGSSYQTGERQRELADQKKRQQDQQFSHDQIADALLQTELAKAQREESYAGDITKTPAYQQRVSAARAAGVPEEKIGAALLDPAVMTALVVPKFDKNEEMSKRIAAKVAGGMTPDAAANATRAELGEAPIFNPVQDRQARIAKYVASGIPLKDASTRARLEDGETDPAALKQMTIDNRPPAASKWHDVTLPDGTVVRANAETGEQLPYAGGMKKAVPGAKPDRYQLVKQPDGTVKRVDMTTGASSTVEGVDTGTSLLGSIKKGIGNLHAASVPGIPSGSSAPAPAPPTPIAAPRRKITTDQAAFLQSQGKFDPAKYEVQGD